MTTITRALAGVAAAMAIASVATGGLQAQSGAEVPKAVDAVDAEYRTMALLIQEQDPEMIEMIPLVNPGAISATGLAKGASADEVWNEIIGFNNDGAGRNLSVLQDVYTSESDTTHRNQAIAP